MMSKKTVRFMVTFEVDDAGELDTFVMRDGLQDLAWKGIDEGLYYTTLDDITTGISSVRVRHVSTEDER